MNARLMAAGLALLAGTSVAAQDVPVCTPSHIVDLSQRILDERAEAGRFGARRLGDTEAYLLYHYGGLSDAAMFAVLESLSDGGPMRAVTQAREMTLALAVSRDGPEALVMFGRSAVEEFSSAGWHLQRAIMRLDDGETYFDLVQQARADPQIDQTAFKPLMLAYTILIGTIGRDQASMLRMVGHAEAAGDIDAAAVAAIQMQDRSVFEGLIERHGDGSFMLLDREAADRAWVSWIGQSTPWAVSPSVEYLNWFRGAKMIASSGPSDWTRVAVNITGQEAVFRRVGDEYLTALEAGRFDPDRDPEEVWLWQYRRAVQLVGEGDLVTALDSYDWPRPSLRHFAGSAQRSMEIMILMEALTPVVQGADWPEVPEFVSVAEFEGLRPLVTALQVGEDVVPQSPEEAAFAFELLWRSGDLEGAVTFADAHMEVAAKLAAFRDVSRRMDALCDQVLVLPGQSLILGGGVIYQFPPQTRNE